MLRWFGSAGLDWGVCAITEAGALRILSNPKLGRYALEDVSAAVEGLAHLPGYRYWPAICSWRELAAPLHGRVIGYQQITDAYLLGLAVREEGVLVTFDRAIRYLAGVEFAKHLMLLE
jgi:hypothetical protein